MDVVVGLYMADDVFMNRERKINLMDCSMSWYLYNGGGLIVAAVNCFVRRFYVGK